MDYVAAWREKADKSPGRGQGKEVPEDTAHMRAQTAVTYFAVETLAPPLLCPSEIKALGSGSVRKTPDCFSLTEPQSD